MKTRLTDSLDARYGSTAKKLRLVPVQALLGVTYHMHQHVPAQL